MFVSQGAERKTRDEERRKELSSRLADGTIACCFFRPLHHVHMAHVCFSRWLFNIWYVL